MAKKTDDEKTPGRAEAHEGNEHFYTAGSTVEIDPVPVVGANEPHPGPFNPRIKTTPRTIDDTWKNWK